MTTEIRTTSIAEVASLSRKLSGSVALVNTHHWYEATAHTIGADGLMAFSIHDGDTAIGTVLLARERCDWRTGSPGQTRLVWPMHEFGYHFGPVWCDGTRTTDWVAPLRRTMPRVRIELRRSAPSVTAKNDPACESGPPTFGLDVCGDLMKWKRSLRGSHRRDLDYYRRRICRAGGEFHDFVPGQDLGEFLEPCFDLHARRVTSKGQKSLYLSERGRTFLTNLAERTVDELRISLLTLGSDVIGSCLSFVHAGQYSCFMPGWDPAHRQLDLGRQLIYHQLLNEFERGLQRIDLLGGDLPYKREFGLSERATTDLVLHPGEGARVREDLTQRAVKLCRRVVRS